MTDSPITLFTTAHNRMISSRQRVMAMIVAGFCLLAMSIPPAMAQDDNPRVSVEFIVFERTGNRGHDEERWPEQPGMPAIEDAVEVGGAGARQLGIQAAGGDKKLAGAARTINNEREYRVLRHERWTLPEMDRDNAPLVRVHLDERPDPDRAGAQSGRQRVFADDHMLDRPDSDEQTDEPAYQAARPLDGTLSIYRTRYFHVAADLLFNPVDEDETPSAEERASERRNRLSALLAGQISFDEFEADSRQPFPGYRLTESRRLRLGELHYLDHPRFGLIVRVDRED